MKTHYDGHFWMSQWQFFLGESNIVALYLYIIAKLGKSEMKIKTYILIFQTPPPKKKKTKMINV